MLRLNRQTNSGIISMYWSFDSSFYNIWGKDQNWAVCVNAAVGSFCKTALYSNGNQATLDGGLVSVITGRGLWYTESRGFSVVVACI